jgi:hypothetical protein
MGAISLSAPFWPAVSRGAAAGGVATPNSPCSGADEDACSADIRFTLAMRYASLTYIVCGSVRDHATFCHEQYSKFKLITACMKMTVG